MNYNFLEVLYLNYAEVREVDTANCKGVGSSIFVSGCRHKCEGCFQPELWDFEYGKEFNQDTIDEILGYIGRSYVHSFSFLGGDPFEPENIGECTKLAKIIKEKYPNKILYAWSGCLYDELIQRKDCRGMLEFLDYLIDGEFKISQKKLGLHLMGSDNQRIIDVQESLRSGNIVEISYDKVRG